MVAVVANDAGINSVNDLRDSRFCHPGHGLTSHWNVVLANVSARAATQRVQPTKIYIFLSLSLSLSLLFFLGRRLLVFRIDAGGSGL